MDSLVSIDSRVIRRALQSSEGLTPRQAACVELLHLRNSDIAEVLSIRPATVKAHLRAAYTKLGAETRTAARVALLRRAA